MIKLASQALSKAEEIFILGYSFPEADVMPLDRLAGLGADLFKCRSRSTPPATNRSEPRGPQTQPKQRNFSR